MAFNNILYLHKKNKTFLTTAMLSFCKKFDQIHLRHTVALALLEFYAGALWHCKKFYRTQIRNTVAL